MGGVEDLAGHTLQNELIIILSIYISKEITQHWIMELKLLTVKDNKIMMVDNPCMSLCSCHFREGHLEVVKYIVENSSADVNTKNDFGITPLDYARQ